MVTDTQREPRVPKKRLPLGAFSLVSEVKVTQTCLTLQPTRLLCPWDSPGQESCSGEPVPSPDLPDLGIKPRSPALQADSLQSEPRGKPTLTRVYVTEHSSRMLLESKQCHSWLKTLEKKISPAQEKPHEITNAKLEPRSSEKQVGRLPVLKIGPAALIQMLRINHAVNHPG